MPMHTRTRTLKFTAVLTFVVLGLTGFTGRHHSRHGGSGGGGCSSSHQDHDSHQGSATVRVKTDSGNGDLIDHCKVDPAATPR